MAATTLRKKLKKKNHSTIEALIDLLPFDTYEFSESGSQLNKKVGKIGKNLMEQACEEHDLIYGKNGDRHKADLILADKAFSRLLASNSDPDEKTAALITACCMVSKITFEKCFDRITKTIRKITKKSRSNLKRKVRRSKKGKDLQTNS